MPTRFFKLPLILIEDPTIPRGDLRHPGRIDKFDLEWTGNVVNRGGEDVFLVHARGEESELNALENDITSGTGKSYENDTRTRKLKSGDKEMGTAESIKEDEIEDLYNTGKSTGVDVRGKELPNKSFREWREQFKVA